jgi:REP element-mobilizing transposase RayT
VQARAFMLARSTMASNHFKIYPTFPRRDKFRRWDTKPTARAVYCPGGASCISAGIHARAIDNGIQPFQILPILPISRRKNKEAAVWKRRFWEYAIRDQEDLNNHVEYFHFNPVKHGLVRQVKDWPWSSVHRYVEEGLLEPDWSGIDRTFDAGE